MRSFALRAAIVAGTLAPLPLHAQAQPSAADVAALRAELDTLRAKVDALERQLAASESAKTSESAAAVTAAPSPPPAAPPATTIAWKGAPQFEDKAAGFSFKPKGFAQFDGGYVDDPGGALGQAANLGGRARVRRAVFGAEGTLPGGFGYKAEFNLADGSVGYEDVVLTWQPDGVPLLLTIGHAYPLSGLEVVTSSRLTSFAERNQATDAFNLGRKVGASLGLVDPKDRYTLTAGLYQTGITSDFADNGWQASVRGTISPRLGDDVRLHLGASYQRRENRGDTVQARYRARPFTNVTDFRFVDTGALNSTGDEIFGVELAGIFGPVHATGEGYRLRLRDFRPSINSGAGNILFRNGPGFTGAYGEIGWYMTGETRGYKGGRWDRAKVLKPLGDGGWGALQLNARIDWLDLTDTIGRDVLAVPLVINGGQQTGYSLGAAWNPTDYVRFILQYSRIEIEGGPWATIVVPGVVTGDYSTDAAVLRAQFEF